VAIWAEDIELMRAFYEKYRRTGDGYYESMVADPEGNRVVIAE